MLDKNFESPPYRIDSFTILKVNETVKKKCPDEVSIVKIKVDQRRE